MFAVVEIAGVQFEVEKGSTVKVPLLDGKSGDEVEFSNILMGGAKGKEKAGTPYLKGSVKAKIMEHGKDDKVLVFHKKRRKGYRKLNGHRQQFTKVEITDIKIGRAKTAKVKEEKVAEDKSVEKENNE